MNKLKIFSDTPLSESALELLQDGVVSHELVFPAKLAGSVLSKSGADPALAQADIAFGQPEVAAVMQAKQLRWLHISSAGFTRYDTAEFRYFAKSRGLLVTNSSDVYAEACAEHVLAFMLAHARQLPRALQTRCPNGTDEWFQLRNAAMLIRGQSVLILGFGVIATLLVEMLRPFGMSIEAFRRSPRGDEGIPIVTLEQLPQALGDADHVINILPDNKDSFHFISAERLSAMKKGAVLYNIGRGATVDQDALLTALQSRHLDAAWLDVTDPEPLPPGHPLLNQPNCFITPHVAGGHKNESETLVRHFVENFRLFLAGSPLRNRIM